LTVVVSHVITHGLFFAVIADGYLLLVMVLASPRVWGYNDYPEVVKNKVPPQTKREKRLAAIVGIPWFIFLLGFPIFSTYALKTKLGGEIPFLVAFLNVFVLFLLTTLGDLVILDWLIVSKATPQFVIIPGSEKADYKDFSHHYKAHARAAIKLILVCLIIAGVVWYF
jgi:hypothetical protein